MTHEHESQTRDRTFMNFRDFPPNNKETQLSYFPDRVKQRTQNTDSFIIPNRIPSPLYSSHVSSLQELISNSDRVDKSDVNTTTKFEFTSHNNPFDYDNLHSSTYSPGVGTDSDFTHNSLRDLQPDSKTLSPPLSYPTHRIPFSYPSPQHPHLHRQTQLRPISEIAAPYTQIFPYPYFNLVQSLAFDPLLYSDVPLVISAPTGSGKTGVFELALVRWLIQESNEGDHPPRTKCVYMAPIKALCSERYQDWSKKFSPFNVTCMELTGDSDIDDYYELRSVQLILTTPEKWDSMTRKWRDNRALVDQIRLFLVDEVHLLNDPHRGPTIEAVISRMKTIHSSIIHSDSDNNDGVNSVKKGIRLVAASATIPNCEDIAQWFGENAKVVRVDETQRPVPLRRIVLPYSSAGFSEFKFDISLSYKLRSVIHNYSEGKPTLVFCSTRKGTQQAACTLCKDGGLGLSSESRKSLEENGLFLKDSKLRELFCMGIAFHHAGLHTEDRRTVESAFISGFLPVLFSTSTLAMGVNLPAHLVIIKSTQQYVDGAFREYSESQILQMVGRAGRPQFDTHATAVIMTRNETSSKYENFLSGLQTVESYLHQHLIEHLNAEVVLGTIEEVAVALKWIKSTFLYVRVRCNPALYLGDIKVQSGGDELVDSRLQEMCLKDLELLDESELIKLNRNSHFISPTPLGRLMARFCLSFPTMRQLISLKLEEQTLGDTLSLIAEVKEFDDVKLRISEKKVLNSLNRDKHRPTIRYPIKGKIKSTAMKVNCLIQATLGCLSFQDFTLSQDVQRLFRSAYRVTRCLLEIQLLREDFTAVHHAATLHQCVNARLWLDSHYVSKQLDKVGPTISNSLVQAGLTSFKKIIDTNPRQLELIANRHPPFGTHLINSVSSLTNYSLSVTQRKPAAIDSATVDIVVKINNSLDLLNTDKKPHSAHSSLLLVGDPTDRKIFAKYRITDSSILQKPDKNLSYFIRVPASSNHKVTLKVHLKSLKYVGLDVDQVFTPEFLAPTNPIHCQPPQTYNTLPYSSTKSNKRKGVGNEINFDLGYSYYTDSPPKLDQRSKDIACNHRCFDKQLCGHSCCKTGISSDRREKSAKDENNPYKESRRMNSFLEEVNIKQGMLPTSGFSLRLKQTVGALNEYSYAPPIPYTPSYIPPPPLYQYSSHTPLPTAPTSNFVRQPPRCIQQNSPDLPVPRFIGEHTYAEMSVDSELDHFSNDFDFENFSEKNAFSIVPESKSKFSDEIYFPKSEKPVLDSVDNIDRSRLYNNTMPVPCCVVEPMQRAPPISFRPLPHPITNVHPNHLKSENLFSSKRIKTIEQPDLLEMRNFARPILDSKPSFFLSKKELDSVAYAEHDDCIDFF